MAVVTHRQVLPALGRAKITRDTKETELESPESVGLSLKENGSWMLAHALHDGRRDAGSS